MELIMKNIVVDPDTGCWNWTGYKNAYGYGNISRWMDGKRKGLLVHRYVYEHIKGPLVGLCLHHCDNPACCNPEHLYDGTHRQNTDDMVSRGRVKRGMQKKDTKLTDEAYLDIVTNRHITNADMARKYSVSPSHISHLRTDKKRSGFG